MVIIILVEMNRSINTDMEYSFDYDECEDPTLGDDHFIKTSELE
jgi:hypothetical protein